MPNEIQTIAVGIALNTTQLRSEAKTAKRELDALVPPRGGTRVIELILKPKIPNAAQLKQDYSAPLADTITRQINARLSGQAGRLSPKFTISPSSATHLREEIKSALSKGPGIVIPISSAKINLSALHTSIQSQVDKMPAVSIKFTGKFDGNVSGGGAGTTGGTRASRSRARTATAAAAAEAPEDEVITQARRPRRQRQARAAGQAAVVQQTAAQALAAEVENLGLVRGGRAPRSRMVAGKWVTPTDVSGIAYLQKLIEGGVRNVSREREHGFSMRGVRPGAAATTQNPTRATINEENAQMQRGLEALRRSSFHSGSIGTLKPEDASAYAGFLGGMGLRQGMSRPGRGMVQMRRGLSLAGGPANKRALSLAAKGYVLANNAYLAGDYEEAQGLANTAIDVLKTASPEWRRRLGKSANKTRFESRQYTDEADMEGFLASTGMDLPVMLQGLTNSITSAVSAAPKVMEVTNKKGKTRLVMTGNANTRVRKAAGGRRNRKGGVAGGTSISAGRVAAADLGNLLKSNKRPKKELSEDEATVAARPETPEQIRQRLGMPSPEELQAQDTLRASLQDAPISTKRGFVPEGAAAANEAARAAAKARADAEASAKVREKQMLAEAKKAAAVVKKAYISGKMGGGAGPLPFLPSEVFTEEQRGILPKADLLGLLARASGGRLSVFRGGRMGQPDFLRKKTEQGLYGAGAYSTPRRSVAELYARGGRGTGRNWRRNQGQVYEGTMLQKHLFSQTQGAIEQLADELDRMGQSHVARDVRGKGINWALTGSLNDPAEAPTRAELMEQALTGLGYAARLHDPLGDAEIVAWDPSKIINRLAGPKGILPRASGGMLSRMLAQTLSGRTIKPGMVAESQRLNLLMEQRNKYVGATLVGEKGPEIITSDGMVIPYHDQRFPSHMRRRAEGGKINVMGPKGKGFISPSAATGFIKGFGEIARVFVVNWPSIMLGSAEGEGGYIREPRASSRAKTAAEGGFADTKKPKTEGVGEKLGEAKVSASPETAMGRRASMESVGAMRSRLTDVQTGVAEALQMAPARAITTAMTQVAMNTFGGRIQLIARAKEVQLSANKAQQALSDYQKAQRKVINAEQEIADEATGPERKAALKKQLEGDGLKNKGLRAEARIYEETYNYRAMVAESQLHGSKTFLKQAKELGYDMAQAEKAATEAANAEIPGGPGGTKRPYGRGGAVTPGIMGRALGVGTVSALAAGVLFSLGLQATGELFGIFGGAVRDATNTLTHFSASASTATAALAPTAIGAPAGEPRAAILGQLGRLGVGPQATGTSLFAPIIQASQNMAAAQQAQQVSTLMRGSVFYGSRGMNGPIPGLGGDLRNGILGTFINQTPSIGETISGDLQRISNTVVSPSEATPQQMQQWSGLSDLDRFSRNVQKFLGGETSLFDFPWANPSAPGYVPPFGSPVVTDPAAMGDYINSLNETALSGGRGGGPQLKMSGDKVLVQATIDAFSDAGRADLGKALTDAGYVLSGTGGAAPTGFEANRFLQNYGTGLTTGNPQQLWDSMQPMLAAQQAIQQRNAQFQRDRVMPTQLGWQLFQNRQITPGAGTPGGGALPITGEMQKVLQDIADKAQIEIKATVPPETYQAIDRFATYMKNERERVLKESAGLALDQYNYQLKIAVRSAGDLLGLAGMRAQTTHGEFVDITRMGELQREQLEIGRESQRLELAHSQRQINFNMALAELSVAGETPAERAARLRDARLENQYAQSQLDLSKRGFNVGVAIENITLNRQAMDALKNLEFFKRNWEVQLDSTKLTEAETAAQNTLGYLGQIGQTYTDSVLAGEQLVNDAAGQILTQTGQWGIKLDDIPGKYGNINNAALGLLATLQNPLLGGTGYVGGRTVPEGQGQHAAGILGSTMGPTWMQVGEAGTETVAVLRNPRMMQNPFAYNAPAGFGQTSAASVSVSINFNGPVNVRDDSDIDKIVRRVEEMMNHRARSVGV